ncbi:MAG: helix-turn-helix domain-containing protein [Alphaproteobacteria bacterium]
MEQSVSPHAPFSTAEIIELSVAAVALAGVLVSLAAPMRTALLVTWALFCGSVFLMLIGKVFAGFGPLTPIVAVGGAATCGWFWLFSRSLFRADPAFGTRHLLVVIAINGPALVDLAVASAGTPLRIAANGQHLLSSTVLVLSFWEAVRTWSSQTLPGERRLRLIFAILYGAAISLAVVWLRSPQNGSLEAALADPIKALCALAAILGGGAAVVYRLHHPVVPLKGAGAVNGLPLRTAPADTPHTPRAPIRSAGPSEDERRLGAAIEGALREGKAYLTPSLKVSDMAARLRVPDYKVSRAVTAALDHSNFNQLVNAYRVEHAKALLADPAHGDRAILSIALDSGFGSVGPFNRAFKAAVGVTPRAFRATQCGAAQSGAAQPGDNAKNRMGED